MLILPLEKTIDWKKPPVATLALILINSLILFFGPDGSLRHEHWVMDYGFIPAQHRPLTFITHAFLHGGFGHLFGNMLFLFLIGFAVENTLGSWLYLVFYLLAGQCAVLLFWLINSDSTIPLVGASGCIAGLMGLYAALFGLRKIRFFYSLVFYFGYASAPALILLPVWLFNEYYQLRWGGESNVAYVAHMGGLVGGGLLGIAVKRFEGKVDTAYLDESARAKHRTERFEQGIKHMKALEIDKAFGVFQSLVEADPNDTAALLQLYKTAKFKPHSLDYQRIALQVLRLTPSPKLDTKEIHDIYLDYRRLNPSPLPPEVLVPLAKRCCLGGFVDTAQGIALELLALNPSPPETADLLLALAATLGRAGLMDRRRRQLELITQRFPHHDSASIAQRMLNG